MEFLKVWAKHNFHYVRYISVYRPIQPRYFYLFSSRINGNNMNRVIFHSVCEAIVFPMHLDVAVQRVDVKYLTPGGKY